MAQLGKLEAKVELKASADKFYKMYGTQAHLVPNACNGIQTVEIEKGDWSTSGSVKLWAYNIGGKPEIFKEKTELDEANKSIILTALDGHVLKQLKSYKVTFQAIPNDEAADLVKMTMEYEKQNPNDPPPTHYLNYVANMVRDIDAYLAKA